MGKKSHSPSSRESCKKGQMSPGRQYIFFLALPLHPHPKISNAERNADGEAALHAVSGEKKRVGNREPTYKAVQHGTGDTARQSHGRFQSSLLCLGHASGIASPCPLWHKWLRQTDCEKSNLLSTARASLSPETGAGALAASAAADNGGEGKAGEGGGRETPPPSDETKMKLCHARGSLTANTENGVITSAYGGEFMALQFSLSSIVGLQHKTVWYAA